MDHIPSRINFLVDLSGKMIERQVVTVQFEEPAFSEERSWAPLGRAASRSVRKSSRRAEKEFIACKHRFIQVRWVNRGKMNESGYNSGC
jgi:hypothetical protein